MTPPAAEPTKRNYKAFSEEDVIVIKSMTEEGYTLEQIADLLGRDKKSIYMKISNLQKSGEDIKFDSSSKKRWTDEEIEVVKSHIGDGKKSKEIAELLGRSVSSVSSLLNNLRKSVAITDKKYHHWSDGDDAIMGKVHAGSLSIHDAVEQIGTSFRNVKVRLGVLKRIGNKSEIRKFHERGLTPLEISDYLGTDIQIVKRHIDNIADDISKKRLYTITIENENNDEVCYLVKFPKRSFRIVPEDAIDIGILSGEYRCKTFAELEYFTSNFKCRIDKLANININGLVDLMV